jgi:hypothetical protein
LFHCCRDIPFGIVMSDTAYAGYWEKLVPKRHIVQGLRQDVLEWVINRQKMAVEKYGIEGKQLMGSAAVSRHCLLRKMRNDLHHVITKIAQVVDAAFAHLRGAPCIQIPRFDFVTFANLTPFTHVRSSDSHVCCFG